MPQHEPYHLARSTSQPAEMWGRELIVDSSLTENYRFDDDSTDNVKSLKSTIGVSIATQTDNKLDLPAIEKFIVQNPRLVLNILGILEPTYHIECELQPQTLITIPEADVSSPEATTPPDNQKRFATAFGISNPMSPAQLWSSPCNSNNKNIDHCRSTDALLATSSNDCLLQSAENLATTSPAPAANQNESINFSIIAESSVKSTRSVIPGCSHSSSSLSSSGSSTTASSSSSKNPIDLPSPTTVTATQSRATSSHNPPSGDHSLKRNQSWKDNMRKSSSSSVQLHSVDRNLSPTERCLKDNGSGDQEDDNSNYDELNEKCALLCNDVRKNSNSRTSITDLQKRNLLMPRPPFGYRFSAGDADKLEKGIKHIPSTRSLKDS